jgi:hypothetical protein
MKWVVFGFGIALYIVAVAWPQNHDLGQVVARLGLSLDVDPKLLWVSSAVLLAIWIVIAMGFYQEQAKVNVNFILEKGAQIPGFFNQNTATKIDLLTAEKSKSNFDYYYSHSAIETLYSLNASQLSKLKWIITFASIGVFTLLNITALYFLQFQKKEIKIFIMIEAICLALAIAAFMLGKFIHRDELVYPAVRGIMGIVQSPVLVLIFIPAKKII